MGWEQEKQRIRGKFDERVLNQFDEHVNEDIAKSHQAIQELRKELSDYFYDMELEMELILLALGAREHVIFLGKPGVSKTGSITKAVKLIQKSGKPPDILKLFELLIHPYTQISELVGPIDIKKLMSHNPEVGRIPYIQQAHLCVIDEFFNASSPLLNTMLSMMNERRYFEPSSDYYQDHDNHVPLMTLFAASNDTEPERRTDIRAVVDRFAIIHKVTSFYDRKYERVQRSPKGGIRNRSANIEQDEVTQFLIKAWAIEYETALETFQRAISYHDEKEENDRSKRSLFLDTDATGYSYHFSKIYLSLFHEDYGLEFELGDNPESASYKIAKFLSYTIATGMDISPRRLVKLAKLMFCRRRLFSNDDQHNKLYNDYLVCKFSGGSEKHRRDLDRIVSELINQEQEEQGPILSDLTSLFSLNDSI